MSRLRRLADVVARRQVQHLLAVEAGIEAEVEALQRLGGVQAAPADAQRELLLRPPLHLVLQQPLQELDVRPLAVDRLPVAGLQRGEHAGQAQLLELGAQLVLEFHVAPPKRWPNNSVAVRTKVRAGARHGRGPAVRRLQALVEDALDGGVGQVVVAQRPRAGRLQPRVADRLAQAQHAHDPAVAIHHRVGEQLPDHRGGRRADLGRQRPAQRRGSTAAAAASPAAGGRGGSGARPAAGRAGGWRPAGSRRCTRAPRGCRRAPAGAGRPAGTGPSRRPARRRRGSRGGA